MKQILKKLRLFYSKLAGSPAKFSLESRVFHSISVIVLISLAFCILFNYAIGLPVLSLVLLLVFGVLGYIYYLSRCKNKLGLSIIFFGILSNIFLSLNFFYNSGSEGPTMAIFVLIFFLLIAIAPKKQYPVWISLNILTVVSLLAAEYYYPQWVRQGYSSAGYRYADLVFSYIIVIVLLYRGIAYIRENYSYEKKLADLRSKELEQLNGVQNKLFSIVAHDLKSPLGMVQSYLEVLAEFNLSESEKRNIEKDLLTSTKQTSEMLSNLLSWSVTQMDGVKVNLTPVNISDVLSNTLDVQYSIAKEKGIELSYSLERSACILADENMLQLVIRNLVNNAIKFTPAGGRIDVTSRLKEKECLIIIRDNGIGIAYKDQPEIFSLRAKSTFGTKNEKGIGLGLVLCKHYLELQHGRIWFESTPGNGTTFYISVMLCGYQEKEELAMPLKNTY